MTESSYPWDPPGAGSAIAGNQWRLLSRACGLQTPGVLRRELNELVPAAGSGQVTVQSGRAGCYGTLYESSGVVTVAVPANATGVTRFDAVALTFNFATNTAALRYVVGNASAGGPALSSSLSASYDILIALVSVANGTSTPVVTDVRQFAEPVFVVPRVLFAQVTGGPVGGAAVTLATITIPPLAYAYTLDAAAHWSASNSDVNDTFSMSIKVDGTLVGQAQNRHAGGANVDHNYAICSIVPTAIPARTQSVLTVAAIREGGAGNLTQAQAGRAVARLYPV